MLWMLWMFFFSFFFSLSNYYYLCFFHPLHLGQSLRMWGAETAVEQAMRAFVMIYEQVV